MTSDNLAARGRRAVEALPDVVRIGPFDFTIKKLDPADAECDRVFGQCSTIAQTIKLRENMPSPFKAVDTFFHEALHAVYWAYSMEDKDIEERVVGTSATALCALFRDNLWLAGWISDAVEPVLRARGPSNADLLRGGIFIPANSGDA